MLHHDDMQVHELQYIVAFFYITGVEGMAVRLVDENTMVLWHMHSSINQWIRCTGQVTGFQHCLVVLQTHQQLV